MVNITAGTYEPISNELNGQLALLQAAGAIDAAVYLAVESKNIDKLMDAAAMWIGLAERLGVEVEEEEESSEKAGFGFAGAVSDIKNTEEVKIEDERCEQE